MRSWFVFIGMVVWLLPLHAAATIEIPLQERVLRFMPNDSPTGSTPDPDDPNRFRATLSGSTLTIYTKEGDASFVVVRTDFSERQNEDYLSTVSTGVVSCPVTRPGIYGIHIGYWNTDYIGQIKVYSVTYYDLNGRLISYPHEITHRTAYIVQLQTDKGQTSAKILPLW